MRDEAEDKVGLQGAPAGSVKRRGISLNAIVAATIVAFVAAFGIGIGVGYAAFSSSSSSSSSTSSSSSGAVTLRFFAIGDWGRNGTMCDYDDANPPPGLNATGSPQRPGQNKEPCQTSVARAMDRIATDYPVDFVINTGDNFYPLGLNSMEQFKASFRDIYNKPNLQVPFLGVLGNHDYYTANSSKRQVLAEEGELAKSVDSRWYIPQRSWTCGPHTDDNECPFWSSSERTSPVSIVATDTEPWLKSARIDYANWRAEKNNDNKPFNDETAYFKDFDSLVDAGLLADSALEPENLNKTTLTNEGWENWEQDQVDFMDMELSAAQDNGVPFSICVGHHGILSNSESHGDVMELRRREDPNKDSIQDVVERGCDVWFNGHDHNLQLILGNNTNGNNRPTRYVTTGAGSDPRSDVRIDGTEKCDDDPRQCHQLEFGYGLPGFVMGEIIGGSSDECRRMSAPTLLLHFYSWNAEKMYTHTVQGSGVPPGGDRLNGNNCGEKVSSETAGVHREPLVDMH